MKTENSIPIADLPIEISDAAWQNILPFLKEFPNVYVGNPDTCRTFLSALVWMTKQGATWRGWFRKFMDIGIPSIAVSGDGVMRVFLKNFMNIFMMPVKSPRSLLTQRFSGHIHLRWVLRKKRRSKQSGSLGRSHGGFTTKLQVSAVSDTFLPLRFILPPGAGHDVRQAPALIAGYSPTYVIADTVSYDSDALRAEIHAQDAIAVIRPRRNRLGDRPYDEEVYKLRNIIERFFHRLKQFRRVARRYDKYARRYLGFVYFAALLITDKKM